MKKILFILITLMTCFSVFANGPVKKQKDFNNDSVKNYRGSRVSPSEECVVENISCGQKDGSPFIEILFSAPVNPSTLKNSSVLINGKELENARFIFNREGSLCRVMLNNVNLKNAIVTVRNVKSFDGKAVKEYTKKINLQ